MTVSTTASEHNLRDVLALDRAIAILRYRQEGDVTAALDALIAGGIRVLEVTADTPGCWNAIARAVSLPGVFIGVGTVTEIEHVESAAQAGCSFVVTPGFESAVVQAALARGLEVFCGVTTASEVLAARRTGCRFLKLFPAGALGTRYLSELRGPFSQEHFVATGGIQITDIPAWLEAGAFAVAMGSDLAGREAPTSNEQIAELTRRAVALLTTTSSRNQVDDTK